MIGFSSRDRCALGFIGLFALAGCGGCKDKNKNGPPPSHPLTPTSAPAPSPSSSAAGEKALRCTRDATFPPNMELPEASAAAEVELTPGKRELLLVSDGHGKALAWTLPSGPGRNFKIALDGEASADLEGISWHGGKLWTLTSSGAVRVFVPDGSGGLRAEGAPYRIGPPPKLTCERLKDEQCGMNWEGLCLRTTPLPNGCVGYAASKQRGQLVCVRMTDGKLAVDDSQVIALGIHKHSLSDCAFGAAGGPGENALVVTSNQKGGSVSYRVDEKSGAFEKLDVAGTESNEAIAIDRDGALYVFADAHQKKSDGLRFGCEGW